MILEKLQLEETENEKDIVANSNQALSVNMRT